MHPIPRLDAALCRLQEHSYAPHPVKSATLPPEGRPWISLAKGERRPRESRSSFKRAERMMVKVESILFRILTPSSLRY